MGVCGGPSLVREDRDGRTAGEPVVVSTASLGSYVRMGEPLKASKRESRPKTRHPGSVRAPGDPRETTGLIGGAWTAGNRLERSRPNGQGGFRPASTSGASRRAGRMSEQSWWARCRRCTCTVCWTVGGARGPERPGPTRSHPEPGRDPGQRRRVLRGRLRGRRGRCGHPSPPNTPSTAAGWSSGSSLGS